MIILNKLSILKSHKKDTIKNFVFIFFILITINFILFSAFQYNYIKSQKSIIEKNEEYLINMEKKIIGNNFDSVISDLEYLVQEYDFHTNLKTNIESNHLSNEWLSFIMKKKRYDKIRFINVFGEEKIRVNYDDVNSYIVPDKELQNKRHRYYFKETMKLEKGQVYVTSFDLNFEHGKVEKPIKPIIRFAAPAFDHKGNRKGIIVLNILGEHVIQQFREVYKNSKGEIALINDEGFWLINNNTDKEWGFMFKEKRAQNFKNEFPKIWETIDNKNQGRLYSEKGLVTFTTFSPLEECIQLKSKSEICDVLSDGGYWKIVSFVPVDNKKQFLRDKSIWYIINIEFLKYYYLHIITFFLSLFISFLIVSNKVSKEQIRIYATYDMMTKAYNRRAGFELLEKKFKFAKKEQLNLTICYVDVNGLKVINDTLGHEKGDELIKTVGTCIRESIREVDFVTRVGGDEFLIVFSRATAAQAQKIWCRIKENIELINKNENKDYLVSVSHGIAELRYNTNMNLDELIREADKNMYNEKNQIKGNKNYIRNIPQGAPD